MSEALARAQDPLTSHLAADKVNVTKKERLALLALATHGPLTNSEIAACTSTPRDTISPRMKGLVEKKLAFNTGKTRQPDRFGVSGLREQIIWCILPPGTELVKDEAMPLIRSPFSLVDILRALLKVAKCPACDGSGSIQHQIGEDEWEAEQCQWCFERAALQL